MSKDKFLPDAYLDNLEKDGDTFRTDFFTEEEIDENHDLVVLNRYVVHVNALIKDSRKIRKEIERLSAVAEAAEHLVYWWDNAGRIDDSWWDAARAALAALEKRGGA